jgi:hypothetical protein
VNADVSPCRALAGALALGAAVLAGCGGAGDRSTSSIAAANPAPYPPAGGRPLPKIEAGLAPATGLIVTPATTTFHEGRARIDLAVKTVEGKPVAVELALYVAPAEGGAALGPFVAHRSADPASPTAPYAARVRFTSRGYWDVIALIRDGSRLTATALTSARVR